MSGFISTFNNIDYVEDKSKKLMFSYIGNQYIRSTNNVFGVQFVGDRSCFHQSDFVCPFKSQTIQRTHT